MTDNNPYVRNWRAKGWLPPKQNLSFDCADCNTGEPDQCLKASYCQHRDGPRCEVLDEDWLADVIADSLDMDWTPHDGARAIIKALAKSTSWEQRS